MGPMILSLRSQMISLTLVLSVSLSGRRVFLLCYFCLSCHQCFCCIFAYALPQGSLVKEISISQWDFAGLNTGIIKRINKNISEEKIIVPSSTQRVKLNQTVKTYAARLSHPITQTWLRLSAPGSVLTSPSSAPLLLRGPIKGPCHTHTQRY